MKLPSLRLLERKQGLHQLVCLQHHTSQCNLLNQRLMEGKAMIITTNLTVEETAQRYSPQIASRLQGEFSRLPFLGNDIRVLKNGGRV